MNTYQSLLLVVFLLVGSVQLLHSATGPTIWQKLQHNMPKKETIIKVLGVTGTLTSVLLAYYYGYCNVLTKMITKKQQPKETAKTKETKTENNKKFIFFSANEDNKKMSWSEWFSCLFSQQPKASVKNDVLFIKDADGKVQLPEVSNIWIYTSEASNQKTLQALIHNVLQQVQQLEEGYSIESYTGEVIREEHWISSIAANRFNQKVTSDQLPFMAILRNKTGKIEARFVVLIDMQHQFAKIVLSSINFTADRYKNNKALFDFVVNTLKYNFQIETMENDTQRFETETSWAFLGNSGHFMRL